MINNNFKLVWIGKLISQLGDKFYWIALAWWILQETGSTVSMGLFMFASAIPGIILGLFTGAISDRWNRKNIMVVTDAVRGILVIIISILSYLDMLRLWQVFAIGISLSAAGAFFSPASQAILPDIVSKEELGKANSMSQLVDGLCSTLGPMLGALSVSFFGTSLVFLMNSISFFVAMVLSALIRYEALNQNSDNKEFNIIRDIGEGLRYIGKRKVLPKVLVVIGVAHFFTGSLSVCLPFLANGLIGPGVNILGLLEMLLGTGLIAGALFCRWFKAASLQNVSEKGLMKLLGCYGLCLLAISAGWFFRIRSVIFYLPILFVIGAVIANAGVFWQLLIQSNTPSDRMGRVIGIASLLGNVSMPIAYGIVGVVLKYSGIAPVMLFSGAALMLLSFIFTMVTKCTAVPEVALSADKES